MAAHGDEKDRSALEREQAWVAAGRRQRLVHMVGLPVAACAAIAAIVFVVPGGPDGDINDQRDRAARPIAIKLGYPAQSAPIPERTIGFDSEGGARAAGCAITEVSEEGSGKPFFDGGPPEPKHVKGKVDYKSNPPTSGDHSAVWAKDGNYAGRRPPEPEQYVHSLERGSVVVQYKPGTPQRRISQLQTLMSQYVYADAGVDAAGGRYALLLENTTGMPYAVAATAWGVLLSCPTMNDRVFEAIRDFRTVHTARAPNYPGH